MQNSVSNYLNLIRHYQFTFFEILGEGPFTVNPIPNVSIKDSVNFYFSYTVTNSITNTCKFLFYNLGDDAISLFTSSQNRRGFIFDTWYGNNTTGNKTIFKGLTFTVNTYRQGTDTITEVCGCDVFLNLLYKGIAVKYPPNTTYLFIVEDLLKYYGNIVPLSASSKTYLTGVYKTPKTFTGQLVEILKGIAADAGLIFSIQLNSITMIPKNLQIPLPTEVQLINARNGLVGYIKAVALSVQLFPVTFFDEQDLTKNLSLISLSTLIRPYNLYDKVYVESETQGLSGYYGILHLTQAGEWRSNQWYSTLTLWPDQTQQQYYDTGSDVNNRFYGN